MGTIVYIYLYRRLNRRILCLQHCNKCDLLIGAVLIPGAKSPKLVIEEMVMNMKPGSVIGDVAIDQGLKTMVPIGFGDDENQFNTKK